MGTTDAERGMGAVRSERWKLCVDCGAAIPTFWRGQTERCIRCFVQCGDRLRLSSRERGTDSFLDAAVEPAHADAPPGSDEHDDSDRRSVTNANEDPDVQPVPPVLRNTRHTHANYNPEYPDRCTVCYLNGHADGRSFSDQRNVDAPGRNDWYWRGFSFVFGAISGGLVAGLLVLLAIKLGIAH